MSQGHHIYGPSSLERRMLCPGSKRMEAPLWDSPEEDNEDAAEGTLLHRAIAGSVAYDDPKLDMDQRILIQKCLEVLKEHSDWNTTDYECFLEGKLFSGTVDVLAECDAALAVIDWKFGRVPVTVARENIQVAAYAVLAAEAKNWTSDVVVRIFQPRLGLDTSYVYKAEEIANVRANIEAIIAKCEKPDAPLQPGDKQCKYCKARNVCPEVVRHVNAMLAKAPETLKPVKEWSPDEISLWFSKFQIVEKFAKDVKADLKRRIEESKEGRCGIWKLGKPKTTRAIEDITQAFGLASKHGMKEQEFLAVCSVSMPKLQEAIANIVQAMAEAEGTKKTAKAAKEEASKIMEPIIKTDTTAPSLERIESK